MMYELSVEDNRWHDNQTILVRLDQPDEESKEDAASTIRINERKMQAPICSIYNMTVRLMPTHSNN